MSNHHSRGWSRGPDREKRTLMLAVRRALEQGSHRVTLWVGSSWAFALAVSAVVLWAISGPLFHYSDTWQLIINTSTTVVTFLIVFLLQRSQNKDSQAVHIKLNEIVAALEGASNRLIDVESLSEDELETLHKHFERLSQMACAESQISRSHSVEEAEERHHLKMASTRGLTRH
jgi:low affinity Fe/Cu permease